MIVGSKPADAGGHLRGNSSRGANLKVRSAASGMNDSCDYVSNCSSGQFEEHPYEADGSRQYPGIYDSSTCNHKSQRGADYSGGKGPSSRPMAARVNKLN